MTALSAMAEVGVHTGACVAIPRALADVALRFGALFQDEAFPKEYCLHDQRGRPLGVIRGTSGRPRLGADAPTLYLQRG